MTLLHPFVESPGCRLAFSREPVDDRDAFLVKGLRMRDAVAFDEIVKRYERPLLKVALRITNNREDAEEVVQDSFLRVFQRIESFRGESLFRTWLVRIATNEALMKIRSRKMKAQVYLDDKQNNWSTLRASGQTPEESYSLHELEMASLRVVEYHSIFAATDESLGRDGPVDRPDSETRRAQVIYGEVAPLPRST